MPPLVMASHDCARGSTYACTAFATYGTADNGIAPRAAEFCAIASVDGIVVIIVAGIREGKVHRIDHTLIIDSCVLFSLRGWPLRRSRLQIRLDFGRVAYRGKPLIAFGP
jgi:hypothetical protein